MSAKVRHTLIVSAEAAGLRLDKWLAQQDFITSRSRAADLIERGLVTQNQKALKAANKVQAGMTIQVEIPPATPSELKPLDEPLDILYQDADVVVINKPSGLVVHPAAGHAQDTLVNLLLHHVRELSVGFAQSRPGIVHRLDRDTSGILVVAKNDETQVHLAAQFRHKTAHRIYWALVHGQPKVAQGSFSSHLARHPSDRKRFSSQRKGKLAITHFEQLHSNGQISWLRLQLETGRTHQIRVHLSEAALPIIGDPIYGLKKKRPVDSELGRLALHACELGFEHPRTHERLHFRLPWPDGLADFVKRQGWSDVST